MRKARVWTPIMSIMLVSLLISGCGTVNQSSQADEGPAPYTTESGEISGGDENAPSDVAPGSFPLSELSSIEGISAYVDQNGICTPLQKVVNRNNNAIGNLYKITDSETHLDYYYDVYPFGDSFGNAEEFIQVSPANGDRIITTINDVAKYYPISEFGYYGIASYSADEETEINGNVIGENTVSEIVEQYGIRYFYSRDTSSAGFYSPTVSICPF